jgi:hypothetical protein
MPIYEPALPDKLTLTINLKQHAASVRPFLDSLPKPFSWMVEPEVFSDFLRNVADTGRHIQFDEYTKFAQDLKNKGNEAFAKGDRKAAIKAYKESITRGIEALNTRPTEDKEKQAFALLAVLHSNLAATYLMPGEKKDAKKAL